MLGKDCKTVCTSLVPLFMKNTEDSMHMSLRIIKFLQTFQYSQSPMNNTCRIVFPSFQWSIEQQSITSPESSSWNFLQKLSFIVDIFFGCSTISNIFDTPGCPGSEQCPCPCGIDPEVMQGKLHIATLPFNSMSG